MSEPAVRARHLKQTLTAALRTPAAGAVHRFVPAAVLEEIEAAHGSDWLPIGHDVALVRVIHGALGPASHDSFARGVVLEALDGPLLGPMARIVLAAFGRDAAAWARLVPRAWSLVFRNGGAWEVERGAGEVRLRVRGLPAACVEEPVWLASAASSMAAVLDATGVSGSSTLEGFDPTARAATYALRWAR
ncbi:hypothetical protein [Anaeromyxobacter oryzae]|uniref:Uncharacterized protein n=1 Tax=Anaeromyxobacter oryzae TaxID=2918170 RepID=A0ABN6MS59_9BACT|nr:hypothetical protein [Anaeromyxobacter oryzae]BDG03803.1 hypothetical protein AMOR_27990 [Anaeromyxobacter oryzae]